MKPEKRRRDEAEAQRQQRVSQRRVLLSRARSIPALAFVLLASSSCEWFTDFKRQPSLWTWEPVKDSLTPSRGNPQYSVPVTGMAVSAMQVSYAPLPGTIDSMASLRNPTPISEQSLHNGRMYFQINCSVCHGDAGAGDGPATKLGVPGISLVTDITKARTDGYIFGMIRNGRGLMPSYNRIEEPDRWDVVNYLRGLQGMAGVQVATGPLAAPGVTGDKLPGVTRMAPTRPTPFMDSRNAVRGTEANAARTGSSNADSAGAPLARPSVDSAAGRTATDSAGRSR